jgi:hypothetical protein
VVGPPVGDATSRRQSASVMRWHAVVVFWERETLTCSAMGNGQWTGIYIYRQWAMDTYIYIEAGIFLQTAMHLVLDFIVDLI